ncbi:MAG: cysteine hydrolase [Cyclobacteriaceae bacterium]|nr:cysteine hydrolase [Cyclobacteriaceae bacterium]
MRKIILLSLGVLFIAPFVLQAQKKDNDEKIRISLQQRVPSKLATGATVMVGDIQEWATNQTAIIICDMWDWHWCKESEGRVAEMAPYMNEVVKTAREKGVFVVHAPSDVMDFYKGHKGRKMAMKYKKGRANGMVNDELLDTEKGATWPIDQSDGGCDCGTDCKQEYLWKRQIETIEIFDGDAISDSGVEIGNMFYEKGIKNVILMGVHTNMCVINRSFGLRNMVRLGMNVALMRDLTDTMYNPERWPQVDHFTGNSLIAGYIEKYVCPTMVSTDLTGKPQYRFEGDKRPLVAMVMAESEYRSNQRLPELARELMLNHGVNCEFAIGKAEKEGEGRHNIENLQILNDADMMLVSVRRRALPPHQMEWIKGFVAAEKPVLGIRTASHAFDAKKEIDGLAQWPEFDQAVLGGNYHNHYGDTPEGTEISVVPGMENHPLLREFIGFNSPGSLYKNAPLGSDRVQVLLTGHIAGYPAEPVLWLNNTEKNKVVCTSLGHWDDWENEGFRRLMVNAVKYLLDTP